MNTRHRLAVVAALALAPVAAHAADKATAADQAFVAKVSQGGMYEVEASKVAEDRAAAPDVKDVAVAEVHDHSQVNRTLKKIADAAGVPVAAALNDEFTQRLAKLKAVPADKFDAAYLADMDAIHAKDEKLFAKEAEAGSGDFKSVRPRDGPDRQAAHRGAARGGLKVRDHIVARHSTGGTMNDWRQQSVRDPGVSGGQLTARGTRIPVTVILDSVAEGDTRPEILAAYPALTADHINAALSYAAELAREESLLPVSDL